MDSQNRHTVLYYHPSVSQQLVDGIDDLDVKSLPLHNAFSCSLKQTPIIVVTFSARHSLQQSLSRYQWANAPRIVLVDAPDNISIREVIHFGRVQGVFYKEVTLLELTRGLAQIIQGEVWFNRELSNQLLRYFHSIIVRYIPPHKVQLTHREIQVLNLLKSGSSNSILADTLCISEHTIKSHLYRIFRKLDVDNRHQAAAWAHHYLEDRM
ncbi:LuxR C-terminal-related transcriptional regulator [Vibrio ulleungensis]|uniref:DNA-binding response regulator n=1 Tax=Vibrio ulleungensis TaxID=2807619 RepID=A0ABS2HQ83_9VIBR|nr:LuxR C-terminal-related transcriptional regulator [Vibrio ulleungensis]MBM7038041.1 DNA-binding response regulator [Vibrio ulleungensis]